MAEWFEEFVIHKRGLPIMVRSDNGSEWAKDFMELCDSYGIRVRKIKPRHSRSNGMAERTVKTIKIYLDKYTRTYPGV